MQNIKNEISVLIMEELQSSDRGARFETRVDNSVRVIEVFGELDAANAKIFKSTITEGADASNITACVVDLSGIQFIDTGASRALFEASRAYHKLGKPFVTDIAVSEQFNPKVKNFKKVFDILGFTEAIGLVVAPEPELDC